MMAVTACSGSFAPVPASGPEPEPAPEPEPEPEPEPAVEEPGSCMDHTRSWGGMVAALAGCGVPLTMGPPHTRTQPKRSRATTTLAAAAHSSCTATDDSWASTTHSNRPLCMSQQWSCRTDSANRRSVDSSTHSADATPATLSMDRCSATRYGGGGGPWCACGGDGRNDHTFTVQDVSLVATSALPKCNAAAHTVPSAGASSSKSTTCVRSGRRYTLRHPVLWFSTATIISSSSTYHRATKP